jgi:hypothetical protein
MEEVVTSNPASIPPHPNPFSRRQAKACWFRIVLESESVSPITNCCGVLTEITKDGKTVMGVETFALKFASGKSEENEATKTIHCGIKSYLDVIAVLQNNTVAITTAGWRAPASIDQLSLFKEKGTYNLKVVIGCDDPFSIDAKLDFVWTGDWNTADLVLVDFKPVSPSSKSVAV